jgi:hypothetical protein
MAVTVLSGPERRRRWSSTEKRQIVQESLAPAAQPYSVCGRPGRFQQNWASVFFLVVGDVVVQLDFKKIGLTFFTSYFWAKSRKVVGPAWTFLVLGAIR